ncbi:hypothetical protein [Mycobacterium sp. 050134]|uniref:hypothetical protein n=1 Tax=Mycobacterium sp. 050134 TaxID=3096111 RepID=UPI002ED79628
MLLEDKNAIVHGAGGTMAAMTHRKRATTLGELADAAAFVASDRAAAMTGTVANLTGGIVVD